MKLLKLWPAATLFIANKNSKYSQGRKHGYEHARERLERLTLAKKAATVIEKDEK